MCKRDFKSIFHKIKSDVDYQEYQVVLEQPVREAPVINLGDPYDPRRGSSDFRRIVYDQDLWVRLYLTSARPSEPTPEYFRVNPSLTDRFRPWLNKELNSIMANPDMPYVLEAIMELLTCHRVSSHQFRAEVARYIGANTDHFVHELLQFCCSLYDISSFDRNARYVPRASILDMESGESSDEKEVRVDRVD
jgi:hypothetical protein